MSPIGTDPERMNGTPCFTGTRVPVGAVFDLLARDRSVSSFLEQFRSVKWGHDLAILTLSADAVIPPSLTPVAHVGAGAA